MALCDPTKLAMLAGLLGPTGYFSTMRFPDSRREAHDFEKEEPDKS